MACRLMTLRAPRLACHMVRVQVRRIYALAASPRPRQVKLVESSQATGRLASRSWLWGRDGQVLVDYWVDQMHRMQELT